MNDFYFVADWGTKHYLFVDNIMLSSGSMWRPKRKIIDPQRIKLPETVKRVFIDSGGFSLFSQYGKYPFTVEQYIDSIYTLQDMYNVELVAILDYPCEPEIDRSVFDTNIRRMCETVQNAIDCYDSDDNIPWIPVIQGYSFEEYEKCYLMYQDAGIVSHYWALGSLCSRKGNHLTIRTIISRVKNLIGSAKLHTFGLSLRYLEDPIMWHLIHSSDSAAWSYGAKTRSEKPAMIEEYQRKIEHLRRSNQSQETLA